MSSDLDLLFHATLTRRSHQVQEIVIDYTNCPTEALNTTSDIPASYVSTTWKAQSSEQNYWWKSWNSTSDNWVCHLSFGIPESMGPPVFMYYRLTNFYQNHRRYVQSLELNQLKGTAVPNSTIAGGVCSPLAIDPATGKAYYPCGLIANSMFNDTIGSPVLKGESDSPYDMTNKGIAWASDKALIQKSHYNQWQVVPPPNWKDYDYEKQGIPNLHDNEEFMVWMRTAGLPSFSKLSRRNDTTAMQPGRYQLDINYSMSQLLSLCLLKSALTPNSEFNVTEYAGTKAILLSTRTALGGKNPFMGIAYVVVGGVCVLLGALFTIAYLVRPRYA